ncbi:LytR C-terminal domain-containing protein [Longispora sp. K20-0274]|uniref:LytR C-terminal domain-containing protein n=1 Tax=Longispora sp. K20-0274 TaxID=3088255 RepID=UPI00399B5559
MSLSRVRALAVLGGLLLVAVIVVTWALVHDRQAQSGLHNTACPKGFVVVDTNLPAPADIKVNVFNGTDQVGLAQGVSDSLKQAKFQVLSMNNDPKRKTIKGVVELRYGPKTVGAAQVLRAQFLIDQDTPDEFDPARTDDVVDVVLGQSYRQLASPTEYKQKIGALGNPKLPDNTCASA